MNKLSSLFLCLSLLFHSSSSSSDESIFFKSFIYVCVKNINEAKAIKDLVEHFGFQYAPKEFWPKSKNYSAWLYAIENERYLLSIDKIKGRNICALEGINIRDKKFTKMLKGFFIDGGNFSLSKTLPEDEHYIWQKLYVGRIKELGVDNVFSIRKKANSLVVIIIQQ